MAPSAKLCLYTLYAFPYATHATLYPVSPDAYACSSSLGFPLGRWTCQEALNNLPEGVLPSIFTTRARTATNNYIQVPVRYVDSESNPECTITIDLDGHSQEDQFVFVPWNEIREMAQVIVRYCVDYTAHGGFITYGVGRTLESLIRLTMYEGDIDTPTPAYVEQPDGTVDVNFVAVPSNPATTSEHNIPYYMTVTVSGPSQSLDPEATDYSIGLEVMGEAENYFLRSRTVRMQNNVASIIQGLRSNQNALIGQEHPRWWDFPIGYSTPMPVNVRYACDATLGSPSIGNCEAALYEFLQSGDVTLDPTSGPIIKVSGNCAIAVGANERHSTTWNLLRSVAETLIATCISGPIYSTLGGTAMSQTISARRRSRLLGRRQTETLRIAFPPTFEIAVYLQPAFDGPADQTCPWGVVASHHGDVRQCPTTSAPVRPPERNLGANVTLAGNSTDPSISASTMNQTATYTGTASSVSLLKTAAANGSYVASSLGQLTCPGLS